MKYPANVKWGQQLQVRLLGQSLFLGDSQTDVLNTGTQRLVINVGIEVHEKYPVCIRCGLENTKCSNMGEEKCIISAMQLPTCSAGCPWEDPVSHLVAPRLLQHLSPALCHLPWHTWNRNSFLPSSSHPPHIALSSSQRVPGVLQHHIQHSLTIGTSSLTPFPPAFAVSKEGIPDSCQHHTSAVISQGAQRMYPRSGIRNSVCRGGAGWQNQLHHSLHLKVH